MGSAFCARAHFWAPWVEAPHPEQMCRASCLGTMQPSSRCQAVQSCFPSFIHKPLWTRSAKVSCCLSHVWVATHSMVLCGLCPRHTAQHGRGPEARGARAVHTFLLLPIGSSLGGRARFLGRGTCCTVSACCGHRASELLAM